MTAPSDNSIPDADEQIYSCLNLDNPKSFFLFAGAGSGKTRSLVEVLNRIKNENIHRLRLNGQKVAIITYTNAASDEIKRRLEFDSSFAISTIHSFAWELICPYQKDIKEWIRKDTQNEITELEEKQRTGRAGTKAEHDRAAKIESKKKRLDNLDRFKKFTYNPNGLNNERESLNHSEVIRIASDFLLSIPLMQLILVKKHPILLIDESQDTKKELVDALFSVQAEHFDKFSLGLFGDTMQRIYTDGKPNLGLNVPDTWLKPSKEINYRCPKRIITLINKIRSQVDGQIQSPSNNNETGIVRLFIVNSNIENDKRDIERKIANQMSKVTSDDGWNDIDSDVKTLTLEHHMAARRGGFVNFFEPLYRSSSDSTGLLDGTMHGIPFLLKQLLPLINARQCDDKFRVAQIVKKHSPLLTKKLLKESTDPISQIQIANNAVEKLFTLWESKKDPALIDILDRIFELELLLLPEVFSIITRRSNKEFEESDASEDQDSLLDAWDNSLKSPYSQLEKYSDYISDNSSFGTHQGVKGLEFPRVMVVLDDDEARGFLFGFEKLFGAKALTATDKKNINEGKETSNDRTRRLFYVICSRAEKSLAIVNYTKSPNDVKSYVLEQDWFTEEEIVTDID